MPGPRVKGDGSIYGHRQRGGARIEASIRSRSLAGLRPYAAGAACSAPQCVEARCNPYGYKIGIVVGLLHGCAIYPMQVFDADAALVLIESERITMVPGAPAIFLGLLESPSFTGTDTSSLRFANTGAANVPVALVERLQRELNFDLVITAFGMTECVVATMCRRGDTDETVATTCGRAIDGMETAIADPETGEHLPPGTEGELLLRGSQVMLGYLDDPAATTEAIDADGWLHTGDVGGSTRTATCASPTGSRTCTSPAASTSTRPRWSRR